ncbi:hypothetical protein IJM86_08795, partial [bacterium]|nr:hypothetical protein [bacterium]
SEVRAKIAELEGIVKSKEEEITTMESQRTTLSEGLVELNNAKTEAENREKAQQNAAEALEKARNSAKKYFDKVNAIEDIDIELQEGLSFANAIGRLEDMIKNSNATKTDLESAMDDCKTAESNYNSAKQTKENQEKQRNFEEAVEGIVSAITNAKGEIEAYSDEFGNTKLKNPLDDRELAEKGISYTIDETTLTLW